MSKKIKVGFLIKSTNGTTTSWDCFSALYHYLANDFRFQCSIFVCPDMDWANFSNESVTLNSESCLTQANVPFQVLRKKEDRLQVLKSVALDYLFITSSSPSYCEFAPGLFFRDLRAITCLCYVPYGAVTVTDDPKNNGISWHSCLPNIQNSALIFSDSKILTKILLENGYDPKAVKTIGHLKIESLISNYDKKSSIRSLKDSKFRFTVLLGQHHSMSASWISSWGFGTFNVNFKKILVLVRKNPEILFIFRPHPLLRYAFDELHGSGDYDIWVAELVSNPNVEYSTVDETASLFARADILITDGISYLTEFPIVTNKPMLFLENPNHVPMNALGNMGIEYALQIADFDEVQGCLDHFAGIKSQFVEDRPKYLLRKKLLDAFLPNRTMTNELVAKILLEAMTDKPQNKHTYQYLKCLNMFAELLGSAKSVGVILDGDLDSAVLAYLFSREIVRGMLSPRVVFYNFFPDDLSKFRFDLFCDLIRVDFPNLKFEVRDGLHSKCLDRRAFAADTEVVLAGRQQRALDIFYSTVGMHRSEDLLRPFQDLTENQVIEIVLDVKLSSIFEIIYSCINRSFCSYCFQCIKRLSILGKFGITQSPATCG